MTARIVVVRPGALGDTILALPALHALAARRRPARLDLVGYPSVLRLVEHAVPSLPVAKIHSIDRALFAPLFSGPLSEDLHKFLVNYDLMIAWVHDESSGLRAKLERLPIAFRLADPYPPQGSSMHASQHLLCTLESLPGGRIETLALDRATIPPRVQAPPEALLEGRRILSRLGLEEHEFIAVHPGSGSASKNWPAEKFGALLRVAATAGRQVLVLEGEADREAVQRLSHSVGGALVCVRQPSLLVLAALLSQAGVFVGNDSGVSHLAAATGTPTLAIFGPTDPTLWAPQGPFVQVMRFDEPVGRVWGALDRLASGEGKSPHPRGD